MQADLQLAMEIEHQEGVETMQVMDLSVSPAEELATAVASSPKATPDHTYSATLSDPTPIPMLRTVSSSTHTPVRIYR